MDELKARDILQVVKQLYPTVPYGSRSDFVILDILFDPLDEPACCCLPTRHKVNYVQPHIDEIREWLSSDLCKDVMVTDGNGNWFLTRQYIRIWLDTYRDEFNQYLTDHSGDFNDIESILSSTTRRKFKMDICCITGIVQDTFKFSNSIVMIEYKFKDKPKIKSLMCSVPTRFLVGINVYDNVSISGVLYTTPVYFNMTWKRGVIKHINKS